MLLTCPHCGPRPSAEFSYQGERIARPSDADIQTWRAHLYLRENIAGVATEEWFHTAGCRRFLVVERDTIDNVVRAVRDRGET
jgi:sarcosine oxidase subunit delta